MENFTFCLSWTVCSIGCVPSGGTFYVAARKGNDSGTKAKEFPCILPWNTQIVTSGNLWKAAGEEYSEIAFGGTWCVPRSP